MVDKSAQEYIWGFATELLQQSHDKLSEAARESDWKRINYELGWQDALLAVRQRITDQGA